MSYDEVQKAFESAGVKRAAHWRTLLARSRELEFEAGIALLERERSREVGTYRRREAPPSVLFHGKDHRAVVPAAMAVLAELWDDERRPVADARKRIRAALGALASGSAYARPSSDAEETVGVVVRLFDEVARRSLQARDAVDRLKSAFEKSDRWDERDRRIPTAEQLLPLRADVLRVARYLSRGAELVLGGSRPAPYAATSESLERDIIIAHFAWRNMDRRATKLTPSRNLATVIWLCGSVVEEAIACSTPQSIAAQLPAIRRQNHSLHPRKRTLVIAGGNPRARKRKG